MATAVASQPWGPKWAPTDRSATGVDELFDTFDLDRDGVITRKEVSDVLGGPGTGRRRAVPGPSADLNLGFDPQLQEVAAVESLLEGQQLGGSRHAPAAAAHGPDSRASAFHSVAYGAALAGGLCGDRLQFTVSTVSSTGRKCYDTEARVAAEVTGVSLLSKSMPEPRPWVDDRKDGTYLVQFVCATPGQYSITARINGTPLPLCPVMIDVAPGRASAQHSDLLGAGLSYCLAGAQTDFNIVARDEFGNECVRGGAQFGVRAVGHACLHEVADNEDGTYTVSYSIPEWAQGPVRLEVLLDGVPLKGSPVMPRLQQLGKHTLEGDVDTKDREALSAGFMPAELKGLEWLREHRPPDIPTVPFPGAALDRISGSGEEAGAAAAARAAWRAADEWRALSDLRADFLRCREELIRHQELLVRVGDAVQREVGMLKEKERSVDTLREDLTQVEDRLAWQRRYLSGEYARRLRQTGTAQNLSVGMWPAYMPVSSPCLDPGTALSPPAPCSPTAAPGSKVAQPSSPLDASCDKVRRLQQEVDNKRSVLQSLLDEEEVESRSRVRTRATAFSQDAPGVPNGPFLGDPALQTRSGQVDVFGLLDTNHDGMISREEWANAQLQAERYSGNFAGEYPKLPQLDPPRLVPGDLLNDSGAAEETAHLRRESRALTDKLRRRLIDTEVDQASGGQRIAVLAPPSPPPFAPLPAQVPFERSADGLSRGAQWEDRSRRPDASRSATCLLTVPPPPSPPPPVPGLLPGAQVDDGPQAVAANLSSQNIGVALRRLFQAYATNSQHGMPARGGTNLNAMLHMRDFSRLVSAAQLKVTSAEVDAAFQATIRQFGVGLEPLAGTPAVPFELFTELLISLARRSYHNLGDSEAVAALLEEYMLPLERRLRAVEGMPG
mmetsp:Transcript_12192/g.27563  ORF Transcript_12192/g.27563 Transcript_12192/m.27563 type:complete len:895 (+) Transcript_12192:81-2765(+)